MSRIGVEWVKVILKNKLKSENNDYYNINIDGLTNVHEYILNFISTFPEYLHTLNSMEIVKATPRSWEGVSNIYKYI